jgi:hypothetical protein
MATAGTERARSRLTNRRGGKGKIMSERRMGQRWKWNDCERGKAFGRGGRGQVRVRETQPKGRRVGVGRRRLKQREVRALYRRTAVGPGGDTHLSAKRVAVSGCGDTQSQITPYLCRHKSLP